MTWRSARRLAGSYLQRARGEGVGAVLVRGFGGTLGVNLVGSGVAFLTQVLLARLMGASGYGVFVYAFTCTYLLTLVTRLGLDVAALRFVPAYRATGEWGLLRGFLRSGERISLAISVSVAVVFAVAVWLLRGRLGEELAISFWISCAMLPVFTLMQVRSSYLQALKRVVQARLSELILRPVVLAVGVLAVVALTGSVDAPAATGVNLAAMAGALVLTGYLLSRNLPPEALAARPRYETRGWLRVALPLMLVSGVGIFLSQIGTIVTGALLGTTEAGIYAAASRVALVVVFGLQAVNFVAAPTISELYAQSRVAELRRVLSLTSLCSLALAVPVVAVLVAFGEQILGLFGPRFTEGYVALVILAAGLSVNALTGSVQGVLMMTGEQGMAARIVGANAVLNVALSTFLIPLLGIAGAAVATLAAGIPANLAFWYYARRRLGSRRSG